MPTRRFTIKRRFPEDISALDAVDSSESYLVSKHGFQLGKELDGKLELTHPDGHEIKINFPRKMDQSGALSITGKITTNTGSRDLREKLKTLVDAHYHGLVDHIEEDYLSFLEGSHLVKTRRHPYTGKLLHV